MNDKQIILSNSELDKFLFEEVISAVKPLFPDDHRAALKAGMAIVDAVMEKFDVVAKRAVKSENARKAVAARWSPPPPQNPGSEPVPAEFSAPLAAKPLRKRRTKAEMDAIRAANGNLQPKSNPDPAEVVGMATLAPPPPPPLAGFEPAPPAFAPPPPPFAPPGFEAPATTAGAPTFG
jgi:hypothetical protein